MNFTNSPDWQQSHNFNIEKKSAERKTLIVVVITLITMLAEIIAGWIFGSMALFSDGLHMGTHASALSISLISYILARKLSKDTRYTFGTWKIEILGAY
ncbi:MAG TPA: cation transporter, partial [Bacteroidales bacterium]|nr:cation transporter [Bacteroidales bacterium]